MGFDGVVLNSRSIVKRLKAATRQLSRLRIWEKVQSEFLHCIECCVVLLKNICMRYVSESSQSLKPIRVNSLHGRSMCWSFPTSQLWRCFPMFSVPCCFILFLTHSSHRRSYDQSWIKLVLCRIVRIFFSRATGEFPGKYQKRQRAKHN